MIILKTNLGDIKIALNSEKAPVTAQNFLDYAKEGFYDGTVFHRVIKGFMIQGGGMTVNEKGGLHQKETRDPIKNEAKNGLKNKRGTIAMARTMEPHSATAQFFINTVDNGFLDFTRESIEGWGYCVFGEVTEGMDVVDKIAEVKTGSNGMHRDVPVEPVVIEKVVVEE